MALLAAQAPRRLVRPASAARSRALTGDGPARKAAVVLLVSLGAGAHLVAAATASGVMAWMMAGMALACTTCLVHLWRGTCAVRTSARHLLAMCAVMALFHMAWLTFPSSGGAHHHGAGGPASAVAAGHADHGGSMLGVIGLELLCLAGATVLLRTGAGGRRRSLRP